MAGSSSRTAELRGLLSVQSVEATAVYHACRRLCESQWHESGYIKRLKPPRKLSRLARPPSDAAARRGTASSDQLVDTATTVRRGSSPDQTVKFGSFREGQWDGGRGGDVRVAAVVGQRGGS